MNKELRFFRLEGLGRFGWRGLLLQWLHAKETSTRVSSSHAKEDDEDYAILWRMSVPAVRALWETCSRASA